MSKVIAIIPARGGSKRIPRKNIREFLSKPIIQYSIQAALNSGVFDEIMVSTDDAEIASVASSLGAAVPFMRSTETATDFATTADVLVEVLQRYAADGRTFEYACCLYPTAPFITPEMLVSGLQRLRRDGAKSLMPVAAYGVPIWWALTRDASDRVTLNWPENATRRSQDLPRMLYDSGQFYLFAVDTFLRTRALFTDDTIGVELLESEIHDIDTEEDWRIAEIKYKLLHRDSL